MKKFILSLALALVWASGCFGQGGMMPGPGTAHSVSAAYVGPGDVSGWGTAYAVYSQRCWKSSYTGNVARIRNVGTPATQTLLTCSAGGTVNQTVNTLSTTCATTCEIYIWYDQSGNGRDLDNTVTFTFPTFTLNSINTTWPTATFGGSTTNGIIGASVAATAQSQPITVATIAKVKLGGSGGETFTDGTFGFQPNLMPFANNRSMQAGGSRVDYTGATDGAWESIQSVINGASSSMRIQNTSASNGTPGTNGISSTDKLTVGGASAGGLFDGNIFEVIVVAGAVSGADQSALYLNAKAAGFVP